MAFHRQAQNRQPLAIINMIPLIDVMLVLLIVFIIAAPLITHAVKIDLPKADSVLNEVKPETIQLAIQADGSVYWNGETVTTEVLTEKMRSAALQTPQPELHIQADAKTPYETVAQILAGSAKAGLGKIGFVSDPTKRP